MTAEVQRKLTSLYGSVDEAPANLARVLGRHPELLAGIPGKAPWRWRQLSDLALEQALRINYMLLGPDGAFTELVLDAAGEAHANPAPHKTIVGDLFAGMGRVLKGTAATVGKGVSAGQSLARTLTAARLKSRAASLREARLSRRDEITLEKEVLRTQAQAMKAGQPAPSRGEVLAQSRKNPVDEALKILCDYQNGATEVDWAPGSQVVIDPEDMVGVVGRLQWLLLLVKTNNPEAPLGLIFHGFTPLWRDNQVMLNAFGEVMDKATRNPKLLQQAVEGPDLMVMPDCSSFFFRAQFTDRGIIDHPDGSWPRGRKARQDHLTATIESFHATDPAWNDRELRINRPDEDDKLLIPGRIVNLCYFSDREDEPAPYIHGFNPVFEDNRVIHDAANRVLASATQRQVNAQERGPRLAVHEDGQLFLFNARITRDGIYEDGAS